MLKRVISEKYQTSRKEKKIIQEETSPIVVPLGVTWGCLISSSDMVELFRKKHILGNKDSDGDVFIFIFYCYSFFFFFEQGIL